MREGVLGLLVAFRPVGLAAGQGGACAWCERGSHAAEPYGERTAWRKGVCSLHISLWSVATFVSFKGETACLCRQPVMLEDSHHGAQATTSTRPHKSGDCYQAEREGRKGSPAWRLGETLLTRTARPPSTLRFENGLAVLVSEGGCCPRSTPRKTFKKR